MRCSVYCPHSEPSPRLTYVLDVLLTQWLDIPYYISADKSTARAAEICISYATAPLPEADINIWYHGLLDRKGIEPVDIVVNIESALVCFFSHENDGFDLPFDVFAFIFYLVSRYEEYIDLRRDKHGRFLAKNSLAFKYDFLEQPIIDQWVEILRHRLSSKTGVDIPLRKMKRRITIDVDLPYAFKEKGVKVGFGFIKDILMRQWGTLLTRAQYLLSGKDPFDTYGYLHEALLSQNISGHFFFLCHYQRPFDENHLVRSTQWYEIIKNVSTFADIGLHPSYASHSNDAQLSSERQILQQLSSREILHSRQHFLKLDIPSTYRRLIDLGIRGDHSMCYAEAVGFRAGTSKSFSWYDLGREQQSPLVIYPDCAMDVTLRYYMGLSPNEAVARLNELERRVILTGGDFSIIWHNSSLSQAYGWGEWIHVFEVAIAPL